MSYCISVSLQSNQGKMLKKKDDVLMMDLIDDLFEGPPHRCSADLMVALNSVSVGLWVCVSLRAC